MKKKKILLFSDDMRMSSGVGTMSREMIIGTAHHFDWVQIGGAIKHPEEGKMFDLSEDVNKELGIKDANIKVFPVNGYGNPDLLRQMIMSNLEGRTMSDNDQSGRTMSDNDQSGRTMSDRDGSGRTLSLNDLKRFTAK